MYILAKSLILEIKRFMFDACKEKNSFYWLKLIRDKCFYNVRNITVASESKLRPSDLAWCVAVMLQK